MKGVKVCISRGEGDRIDLTWSRRRRRARLGHLEQELEVEDRYSLEDRYSHLQHLQQRCEHEVWQQVS